MQTNYFLFLYVRVLQYSCGPINQHTTKIKTNTKKKKHEIYKKRKPNSIRNQQPFCVNFTKIRRLLLLLRYRYYCYCTWSIIRRSIRFESIIPAIFHSTHISNCNHYRNRIMKNQIHSKKKNQTHK